MSDDVLKRMTIQLKESYEDSILFREERRRFGRYVAAVEILLTLIDNVEYMSSDDETQVRHAIENIDKEK